MQQTARSSGRRPPCRRGGARAAISRREWCSRRCSPSPTTCSRGVGSALLTRARRRRAARAGRRPRARGADRRAARCAGRSSAAPRSSRCGRRARYGAGHRHATAVGLTASTPPRRGCGRGSASWSPGGGGSLSTPSSRSAGSASRRSSSALLVALPGSLVTVRARRRGLLGVAGCPRLSRAAGMIIVAPVVISLVRPRTGRAGRVEAVAMRAPRPPSSRCCCSATSVRADAAVGFLFLLVPPLLWAALRGGSRSVAVEHARDRRARDVGDDARDRADRSR